LVQGRGLREVVVWHGFKLPLSGVRTKSRKVRVVCVKKVFDAITGDE